jgi:hypothetical protein
VRGDRARLKAIVDEQLTVSGRLQVNTALAMMDVLAESPHPRVHRHRGDGLGHLGISQSIAWLRIRAVPGQCQG